MYGFQFGERLFGEGIWALDSGLVLPAHRPEGGGWPWGIRDDLSLDEGWLVAGINSESVPFLVMHFCSGESAFLIADSSAEVALAALANIGDDGFVAGCRRQARDDMGVELHGLR